MEKVVRFGVSLNSELLRKFDEIIEEKSYMNRSEAIRDLIRDFLVSEEWEKGKEVVGSLTLLYDHEVRGVDERLIDIQHSSYGHIISSMHVHLDERNCIEVLVIKGLAEEVKKIADSLISARGVKHGKLVMTSTGREIT